MDGPVDMKQNIGIWMDRMMFTLCDLTHDLDLDVYSPFIPKYCLIQWISKLHGNFEIHWAVWYKTKVGSQNFGYQLWWLFGIGYQNW